MDLRLSQEQELLRDMVRSLCAEVAPLKVVRAMEDHPTGYTGEFWSKLCELGLTGILLPEAQGGAGMSMIEAAILYEELGRALSPSPHFPSCVLGGSALLAAGSRTQQDEWLPRIASGEAVLTPAWLEPRGGFGARGVQLRGQSRAGEFLLTGTKDHVPFAAAATRLLVLARTGAGEHEVDLFLVDPAAPGVAMEQRRSLAGDTQYRVELSEVRVPASSRLGPPGSGWRTWERVMLDGIILLAAQAMGGAERALEITVDYAKERVQFDKPLGAFQAISHYLADASTLIDGGKTLVYEAAWARAAGRPKERLALMAKLFACQTFRDVTAMCQQVFGGYGFTLEYDIQLYFRRAKQLQMTWWDGRALEDRIAASVLDGEAGYHGSPLASA
ncbi:MAG TPA: acyl-CoA dehydrogenase [Deltaproteobacteria bacterium]|jgi:alkylation response protein AidB-like acyl-CoA dehydrogenase|nr:acyl-CoA dehydrogenase [Deltaproteobacteria bacterium]